MFDFVIKKSNEMEPEERSLEHRSILSNASNLILLQVWTRVRLCYAPVPNMRALSDDAVWRLSVAYIGPKSRTERPSKTKIGTEVAHITRDSDTTFKVKGQGHQAALLTAVLARQAAAAVGVRTRWRRETAATLPSARRRKALRRPAGRRGAGHIVAVVNRKSWVPDWMLSFWMTLTDP